MHLEAAAHAALSWLDTHAGSAQAVLAFVLTAITARYAWLTKRLLNQADASARAAERSAAASENTIAFMKRQHEEQLGQGPQVVREEIARAKGLAASWRHEAQSQSILLPDPDPLSKLTLREAATHARRISTNLVDILIAAENAFLEAQTEMNKFREAARHQYHTGMKLASDRAVKRLDQAVDLLQHAEKLLPRPAPGPPNNTALREAIPVEPPMSHYDE